MQIVICQHVVTDRLIDMERGKARTLEIIKQSCERKRDSRKNGEEEPFLHFSQLRIGSLSFRACITESIHEDMSLFIIRHFPFRKQ